jgi:hypothetical protein
MNKLLSIAGSVLLFHAASFAQTPPYSFKIEILSENNATITAPFIQILFDGHLQKANQDGFIYLVPGNNSGEVMVSVPDQREFMIVGSTAIPLPADRQKSITIVVRKPTVTEKAVQQVDRDLKKLNIRIDQLDSIKRMDYTQYLQMTRAIDSVYKGTTQKFQISEPDLRSATEKMQGRDKYFAAITVSLEDYLNEAKDIRDIFRNMLLFSLENPKSFKLFDSTIYVYNRAYNVLNDNNNDYEKAVVDFWDSKELSLGFHNVFDFAINNIHRASILPLNSLLNEKVNEYIHEKNRSERKTLKTEITATLNAVIPILENNLTILESKIRYYIGELESQKTAFNLN